MAKKAGKCTKYKTKRKVFIFVADEWQMYTQTNTHERMHKIFKSDETSYKAHIMKLELYLN